ncbi:hypothetical protein Dimus_007743 [Dionaea muscipula]
MHIDACKEFYANLTMFYYKKKEVARSRVRGVEIEFDSMRLASILGVPGNIGICEYIKDVWEYSKYINTLETTRRFANNEMITEARRVKSTEMKPFQRTMNCHMVTGSLWCSIEAFDVPLIDKQGEEPKRYDFFEETFLTMCQLKRENGEAVVDEAALQGEHMEKKVEADESGSGEKFFDAEDEVQDSAEVSEDVPDVPAPASVQQKEKAPAGVDPSAPTESSPDSVFVSLQADFEKVRANRIQANLERAQAENARLLSLLQQAQSHPKP